MALPFIELLVFVELDLYFYNRQVPPSAPVTILESELPFTKKNNTLVCLEWKALPFLFMGPSQLLSHSFRGYLCSLYESIALFLHADY